MCHTHTKYDYIRIYIALHTVQDMSRSQGYLALQEVRRELVEKIAASRADLNVLIAKSKNKGIIQSIQASAAVAPGHQSNNKEKAEALVNQVLEAVKADETKVGEFLQLLEECSLGDIAAYLRQKLEERARTRRRRGENPSHHQDGLPKLEPARTDDSAFAEDSVPRGFNDGDDAMRQQEASGGGTSFKPITTGVVALQDDGRGDGEESASPFVQDTQPHTEGQLSVTAGAGSSVPVLPETKRLEQTNKDLQAQLSEKIRNEERLTEELEGVHRDKEEIEKELIEKEKELEEKETQIKTLKAEMERLQEQLKSEKENNVAEKQKLKAKIKELEVQLKEKEDKFHEEKLSLITEKHNLELTMEKMRTNEERLLRQISDEKCKVAELNKEAAERNQKESLDDMKKDYEKKMESMENNHRNSVVELEGEISRLRRLSCQTSEPDTA